MTHIFESIKRHSKKVLSATLVALFSVLMVGTVAAQTVPVVSLVVTHGEVYEQSPSIAKIGLATSEEVLVDAIQFSGTFSGVAVTEPTLEVLGSANMQVVDSIISPEGFSVVLAPNELGEPVLYSGPTDLVELRFIPAEVGDITITFAEEESLVVGGENADNMLEGIQPYTVAVQSLTEYVPEDMPETGAEEAVTSQQMYMVMIGLGIALVVVLVGAMVWFMRKQGSTAPTPEMDMDTPLQATPVPPMKSDETTPPTAM